MRLTRRVCLGILSGLAATAWVVAPGPLAAARQETKGPIYEVYAVRFAHGPLGLWDLVKGVPRTDPTQVDLAFTVWPIRDVATGRVIVFDSGFYRDKFLHGSFTILDYTKPVDAVAAALDVKPEDITDVIISHVHWDHVDGADLFPKANIWLQKDEYEYYVGPDGTTPHRTIDPLDAAMLASLNAVGRVKLIPGDDQQVLPGIRAYLGGKHTYASEYISVPTRSGTVVLASDNAYLFMNLEQHLAIFQTLDADSNLAAQDRMFTLASKPSLVIPGHDPDVFNRFPTVKPTVVRID